MALFLYDKATKRRLFGITAEQRDQLVATLEEESKKDHDYYIDADVLDFLDGKVDAALISQLRPLVGAVPIPSMAGDSGATEPDMPAADITDDSDTVVETDAAPNGIEIEWREE